MRDTYRSNLIKKIGLEEVLKIEKQAKRFGLHLNDIRDMYGYDVYSLPEKDLISTNIERSERLLHSLA